MATNLTALVFGSGWAAEGHTIALQQAGVEVVALASRNEEICRRAALALGIARSGTDWGKMLRDF
jgi:predicted dehydrogenase